MSPSLRSKYLPKVNAHLLGGLRIPTPEALAKGADLWVNVGLPGAPIPVNALATVMWSRPQLEGGAYQSGLSFNAINQEDLKKVEGFLELQKKPE